MPWNDDEAGRQPPSRDTRMHHSQGVLLDALQLEHLDRPLVVILEIGLDARAPQLADDRQSRRKVHLRDARDVDVATLSSA